MLTDKIRPRLRPEGLVKDKAGDTAEDADGQNAKAEAIATVEAPLALDGLMLLGIFGKEEALNALVRLPGGRVEEITAGGELQGRRVAAVTAEEVILQGPGGLRRLSMPDAA